MLLDKLDQAIQAIDAYTNFDTRIRRMRSICSSLVKLNKILDDLDKVISFVEMANSMCTGCRIKIADNKVENIVNSLEEVLASLEEVENYESNADLERAAILFDNEIKWQWEGFVRSYGNEVIQSLAAIEPLIADQFKLKRIMGNIKNVSNKWPVTKSDIQQLNSAISEGKELIYSLDIDDKIKTFLGLVARGEATLSAIDEQILAWIKAHRLESKLKLKFVG